MVAVMHTRLARVLGIAVAVTGVIAATTPLSASAYGPQHLYEVTLSYNCQNVSLCAPTPFGIGGIWGWIEPASDGTVDGQLEFQGHQNANPFLNGTGHSLSFFGYSTISCPSANPLCGLLFPEGVPVDPNGQYFVFPTTFSTAGGVFGPLPVITPATPGHWKANFAPGVSSNATVTAL